MVEKLKKRMEEITPLEEAFWQEVLTYHKIVRLKKNETLVRYNAMCKDVFFVAEGSVKVMQVLEDGSSKAIWFHFDDEYEFMTCLDSYYNDEPTKYELKALEKSILIKFPKQRIDHWVATYK